MQQTADRVCVCFTHPQGMSDMSKQNPLETFYFISIKLENVGGGCLFLKFFYL